MRCEIKCHNNCGRWVGWYYPATSGPDPSPDMAEGPGEDYADNQGEWYCSDKCRDEREREAAAEREPGEQQ